MASGKLTDRFREIVELRWSQFRLLEIDPDVPNFDLVLTNLARACYKGKMPAIRIALERLDGKVAQDIEVQYPTFYTLYPYATHTLPPTQPTTSTTTPVEDEPPLPSAVAVADEPLPTGSLRATVERMLDAPRSIVDIILASALAIDTGQETPNDPLVKSVMAAGLMKLVHDGSMGAVFEVFEQIDGSVKDTIRILGDDVYLTSYATAAPAHAVKNKEGVYVAKNEQITTTWTDKLQLRG